MSWSKEGNSTVMYEPKSRVRAVVGSLPPPSTSQASRGVGIPAVALQFSSTLVPLVTGSRLFVPLIVTVGGSAVDIVQSGDVKRPRFVSTVICHTCMQHWGRYSYASMAST